MVPPTILTVTFPPGYKRWPDGSDSDRHVLKGPKSQPYLCQSMGTPLT